jgi:hypothetical protein
LIAGNVSQESLQGKKYLSKQQLVQKLTDYKVPQEEWAKTIDVLFNQ